MMINNHDVVVMIKYVVHNHNFLDCEIRMPELVLYVRYSIENNQNKLWIAMGRQFA
jgi:hypothetical protein